VQSFNRYAYANNNPYRYVDPDGKESVESVKYRLATGMVLRNPAGGNGTSFPQLMTPVPGYSPAMNGAEAAANVLSLVEGGLALRAAIKYGFGKLAAKKALTTPDKYFVSKTKQEVIEAFERKYGPPKSSRENADTYYNGKTKRSFNVHEEAEHNGGKPHVDIRRRGGYKERKYDLKQDNK